MQKRDKHGLLADFEARKKNRTLEESQDLLRSFDFKPRAATKEGGGVWQRGGYTLTLPKPHGGDKILRPEYISRIVRIIRLAEASDAEDENVN